MRQITRTSGLGGLLAIALILAVLAGLGAAPRAEAVLRVVSDCNGQNDGTPCHGDNGVLNLCFLPGAACQNGLCSGPRMSCDPPQQCATNTGNCIVPLHEPERARRRLR
jgi:hypothetical protein